MKNIVVILSFILISGCFSQNKEDKGYVYIVSGPTPTGNSFYVCQRCYSSSLTIATDCVDQVTGIKIKEILNPTCIKVLPNEK